jgi:glycosyltransferase involved in cell wall biosynthesis
MRIALLHNIVSPHVVPLFQLLAQQPGIALKVYFLAETEQNRRWETSVGQRFDFTVLPNWSVRLGREDLFTVFINPTLISTLVRDGFDVVISVGWDSLAALSAFTLCKLQHKPFVLWSGSTRNEPSWRRSLSLPLVRMLVRQSSSWLAYGTRARDYLVQLGAARERVFVAYNTVDIEWFRARADKLRGKRSDIRDELGLDDEHVVLYVGQFIARKGVRDLVSAFEVLASQHPATQLVLVGYGPLEQELRDHVALRKLERVHFVGHVPIPQLPRFYAAADVLVLPSHEEVWGLVLNEAAACGLPLVTTDVVGAAPDLVKPGINGEIVPAGNPTLLAGALQEALARSVELGRASREIVSGMTYVQNVDAIRAAIRMARS